MPRRAAVLLGFLIALAVLAAPASAATCTITGTSGNDVLNGTAGPDVICGFAGDDEIHGLGGNDILYGGTGADELRGGADRDVLYGGDDADSLYGGDADDTLRPGLGDDPVVDGEGGTDLLSYRYETAAVVVDLGAGTATGAGTDGITGIENVQGTTEADELVGDGGPNKLLGEGGGDDLQGAGGNDRLIGAAGDDKLSGDGDEDQLIPGAGLDTLDGGDGRDVVDFADAAAGVTVDLAAGTATGDGDDTLTSVLDVYGSVHDDVIDGTGEANAIFGRGGADDLDGADGGDVLKGGDGGDDLTGGTGTDLLAGGAGDDALHGDDDADRLYGDADADSLWGGAGDDNLQPGAGDDPVVDGEGGTDLLSYANEPGGVTVDLGSATATGAGSDTVTGIENVTGTAAADELTGDGVDNRLAGGEGDDKLTGNGGADTLYGHGGADGLDGGTANDRLYGNAGDDDLSGGDDADRLYPGAGTDAVHGGAGTDAVDFSGAGSGITADLVTGTATGDGDDNLTAIEDLAGSEHADHLTGDGDPNTIVGRGGDNVVAAGGGADKVSTGTGADQVSGGDGADQLVTGPGVDTIDGGDGDDDLVPGAGDETALDGGPGKDRIAYVHAAPVVIDLDLGTATGGGGDDTFTNVESAAGTAGDDVIRGDEHDNLLQGLGGNDELDGRAGSDELFGMAGDDHLDGGDDADSLDGGDGFDLCGDPAPDLAHLACEGNLPPVVTTSTGLTYTEGAGPVAADDGLTIADADSANLVGATVEIDSGLISGADVLAYSTLHGITGVLNGDASQLTLSGTATVAQYQEALRSVTYANTSDAPAVDPRTVTFQVDDGDAQQNRLSAPRQRVVSVTPTNDAPQLQLTGGAVPYTENDPAAAVAGGLDLGDADSSTIQAATVTIGSAVAGDTLAAPAAPPGISVDFTGNVLTISGDGTLAEYETLLQGVTYESTSDDPTGATRTLTFAATDAEGASGQTSRDVTVSPVNDAPALNLDAASPLAYTEQAGFVNLFGPNATLTDPDDTQLDSLKVTLSSGFDSTFDALEYIAAGFDVTFSGGVLTITKSPGSVADFQTALRGVRFRNTDDDPDDRNDGTADAAAALRTATVAAHDGDAETTAQRGIGITAVNDPPTVPSTAPTTAAVRNTTLVSGTNSVTHPKVTRTVSLEGDSTDPDDPDADIVVQAASGAATAQGGRITLTAAGDLQYEPPASVSLTSDTYAYKLTDGETATADITFTADLSGEVWYVADGAGAPADGTAARPFATVTAAAAASTTGDAIHVRRLPGDGVLDGAVVLKAGQKLIGEGVALEHGDVGSTTPETLYAATAKPTLTATDADVVTAAADTTVAGLTIDPAGTGGGIAGAAVAGAVNVRDVAVSDTGTAASQPGIELTGGSDGALNLAGTVTLASNGARALDVSNAALSGIVESTSVTNSPAGGVSLSSTTGGLTFRTLGISTTGGTGFRLATAAGIDVLGAAYATSVTSAGGPAVDATGLTSGTDLDFDSVSTTGTPAKGINLDGGGDWTFKGSGGALSGASVVNVDVNGGGGDVSYAGTIANGTGEAVDITGRSGNTTLSGNLTGAGGTGINVANNTGGIHTFSGAAKTLNTGSSTAVNLNNSGSAEVRFSGGGLDVDTTSGGGIQAQGTGHLTVQGVGNSIASGTGTALSVVGPDIAAGGLVFESVSANGAQNGVVLSNTGSTAGLTITGNPSASPACGYVKATQVERTANCNGGTILNTLSHGISLTDVTDVALTNVRVHGADHHGIYANGVTDLSLTDSVLSDNGSEVVSSGLGEGGLYADNLLGTASITNSLIKGSHASNALITNTSGTLAAFNVSGSKFSDVVTNNGDNLQIVAQNSAVVTATVNNNTFLNVTGDHFQAAPSNAAVMKVTVSNNTMGGTHAQALGGGITMRAGGTYSGTYTYDITTNTITNAISTGINTGFGSTAGSGLVQGKIRNNSIGTSGVTNSGSAQGSCILAEANGTGTGTHTVSITNNQLRRCFDKGIDLLGSRDGSNHLNATVTANNVSELVDPSSRWAIRVETGSSLGTETGTVCADIANNTLFAQTIGDEMSVRNRSGATMRFPGYPGGATDTTFVANYLSARNPAGGSAVASVSGSATFSNSPGGAICPQPASLP